MVEFSKKSELRDRRAFTAKEAGQFISYEPDTGLIRWKVRIMCYGGGRSAGEVAGSSKDGYIQVKLFGRFYRAHHLAWLLHTGQWPHPSMDVDHIDRNRSNNKISNLRIATRGQNNLNTSSRRTSASGYRGVCKSKNKWLARIGFEGKIIHLGMFEYAEDAYMARIEAEKKYYPDHA